MWPYFDPDYENLSQQINPPRVCIDNNSCNDCTLVTVDSLNKPGILLELVQVLSDLDLTISKAYISSDGQWFMDVFHVTDQQGRKLTDRKTMEHIEKELYIRHKDGCTLDAKPQKEMVVKCLEAAICRRVSEGFSFEICGRDRVGLLSDVTKVLREYGLSVTRADVTTVGEQALNVFYVADGSGNSVDMETIDALRREIGHTVMLNVKRAPSSRAKAPAPSGWAKSRFSFGGFLGKFLT